MIASTDLYPPLSALTEGKLYRLLISDYGSVSREAGYGH